MPCVERAYKLYVFQIQLFAIPDHLLGRFNPDRVGQYDMLGIFPPNVQQRTFGRKFKECYTEYEPVVVPFGRRNQLDKADRLGGVVSARCPAQF